MSKAIYIDVSTGTWGEVSDLWVIGNPTPAELDVLNDGGDSSRADLAITNGQCVACLTGLDH